MFVNVSGKEAFGYEKSSISFPIPDKIYRKITA
jgi:hypothetical protein